MRIAKRFALVMLTGCAALILAGCPQKQPVAVAPPPPPPVSVQANGNLLVQLSQRDASHLKIGGPYPVYPAEAKAAREQGTNVFSVIIGTDGHVRSVELVKADFYDLAASSMKAIRQWKYKPYLVDGKPVEVQTQVTINFSLGN
jgi:TonB family protein